jgi:hypothetical protein
MPCAAKRSFTRIIRLPRGGRIEPQFDIFYVTDSNAVLVITTQLGACGRHATGVLARALQFGVSMNS